MLIPKKTHNAILGQAVGEMIGRCGFIPPIALATALQNHKLPTASSLSSPPETIGLHGSHTQLSLTFALTYQNTGNSKCSNTYIQNLCRNTLPLLPFIRGSAFHFPDVLKNKPVPFEPNLAPAIWMGPVSTMHSSIEELIPWTLSIAKNLSTHPISITGAAFYAAICWGYSRDMHLTEIIHLLTTWRKSRAAQSSPVADKNWWAFEQAFWIRKNYGLTPMLEFVSQTMKSSQKLNTPTPYNILSFLPDVIYNVYASKDFTTAIIPISENTTPEFCTMCGTIASLQGKQPETWMRNRLPTQLDYQQIGQWSYMVEEKLNRQWKSNIQNRFGKTVKNNQVTDPNQLKLF